LKLNAAQRLIQSLYTGLASFFPLYWPPHRRAGTPARRHARTKPAPTTIRMAMRRGGRLVAIANPSRFLHAAARRACAA
jgi:hypothetical protein